MTARKTVVPVLVGLILGAVLLGSAACVDAPREPTTAAPSPTASATASPSPEPTPTAHPGPDRDPDAGPTPTLAPEPTATATATARPHVTLSGTGPATRDIIIPTEGTWTMTIDVSKNSRCDDAKRCRRAGFKIGMDTRGGGSSLVVAETASDWTGQIRLRIANRSGSYAPGARIVTVNVAPMAEWMLTFVPPGAPVPTQRPTATPTPGPFPTVRLTTADVRRIFPCLGAAEADYVLAVTRESSAVGSARMGVVAVLAGARTSGERLQLTDAQRSAVDAAIDGLRTAAENILGLTPPDTARIQALHADAEPYARSVIAFADALDEAVDEGSTSKFWEVLFAAQDLVSQAQRLIPRFPVLCDDAGGTRSPAP